MRFEYHYRRRYLDGSIGISVASGPVLARRDDSVALVVDYPWIGPRFTDPIVGRCGTATVTIAHPPAAAVRLWIWPDRPMRLLQEFDPAGRCTLYRVDFTTPPWRDGAACYQTDLYLDLFAAGDAETYAILDEDELELASHRGLISDTLRERALAQLDELVALIEAGRLRAWLGSLCSTPFALNQLVEGRRWAFHEFAPGEADGWPEEAR